MRDPTRGGGGKKGRHVGGRDGYNDKLTVISSGSGQGRSCLFISCKNRLAEVGIPELSLSFLYTHLLYVLVLELQCVYIVTRETLSPYKGEWNGVSCTQYETSTSLLEARGNVCPLRRLMPWDFFIYFATIFI